VAFFNKIPKNTRVCQVCGNHFELDPEFARWDFLCSSHRFLRVAEDTLKDAVQEWVTSNWQELAKLLAEKNIAPITEMQATYEQAQNSGQSQTIIHGHTTQKLIT